MDSFPNPYAALIATFNQVSPLEKDELDDTQNLPDDDLLLWANAQFTYDIPPGVGIYEDDMGVKLAMSQQQFQHTQQQQQQQQQSQQQPQQFQPQSQQAQSSLNAQQQHQQHALQFQPSDMQRQLQQFDAIHRYLDSTSEDPRTSLTVVERSRQRNPVTGTITSSPTTHQPIHYDPRINALYPHTSHGESSTSFSVPTTAGPISPAAARLLRQPFLPLQTPHLTHQHNHHQQSQAGPSSAYSVSSTPLSSPTTLSDFHHLQTSPLPPITPSKPNDELQTLRGMARKDAGSGNSNSSSSSSSNNSTTASTSPTSPANSATSFMAKASSTVVSPHEEQGKDFDQDHEEKELPAPEPKSSSSANPKSKIFATLEGLSQDDPEYAARLAAEEDKRRRNTAASARFRHKKRLREQILEKTAKEMTAKSEMLEVRVRELEMEIKWLRGLIVEKDSRSLDLGSTTPTSTVSSSLSSESSASTVAAGSRANSKTEGASLSRSTSKAKRGKKVQA
ncbi:hypothetical protein FBU30_010572 [Linnemannia zychae]|nr:hypothetical protein FBU30_010572 [Linnemannia zychae]